MTQTSLGAAGSPATPRDGGRWAAARRLVTRQPAWKAGLSVAMAGGVVASTLAPAAITSLTPTFAATPIAGAGQMITNGDTLPYGAVWMDDASGGHLWVSDNVLGVCRIDPAPAANPPWQRTNCNGTTKAGGQIVVGDTPTTATDSSKFMYVADNGSKSTQVVRFKFDPKTGSISAPVSINAQNLTARGGGAAGGRPVGIALVRNATNPADDDLFVAYLKSGDVMKVTNVKTATATPPVANVNKVGSTSDGRGVNSALYFKGNLYLAEVGGNGLSVIQDPNGLNGRPACTNTTQCTATTVSPVPSFFPGGLAADPAGTYVYVGDAPRVGTNSILRWNPATGAVDSYSTNVTTYTWTDTAGTHTTNQYWAPYGLGVNPHTGDLYVGDDPTQGLPAPGAAAPATTQGHVWKIAPAPAAGTTPPPATGPAITSITPSSGPTAGGTVVTITGTGFGADIPTAPPTPGSIVLFGTLQATNVSCTTTQCTATSPAGTGTVDVHVQTNGQESPVNAPADQFTYIAPPTTTAGFSVASVSPTSGFAGGGSPVTIAVNNAPAGATLSANFGPNPASNVTCTPPAAGSTSTVTTCVVNSPAGTGTVDVQVTAISGTTSQTTPIVQPADQFSYVAASANLYGWGITAPKGGAIWLQGTTAGHWWSSDHAQGICRQDAVPGSTTLHALNFGMCGDDAVGSAGQAVVDPRPIPGAANTSLRYVYVPDNAVKSTAVWRLTFDPAGDGGNGAMVADPAGGATATAMLPLADVRTLKPNGMAIGPLLPPDPTTGKLPLDPVTLTPQVAANASLYVTDLTEANVRAVSNPNADPRTQAITIVAVTGDARGANGTAGFVGNNLYISENRGTSFFDVTQCPMAGGPCGTIKIPLQANAAGVFVAGSATDPIHGFVYSSDSPGGANATIYRYDARSDKYAAFLAGSAGANPTCGAAGVPSGCALGAPGPILVTGGTLPATGVAVACAVPSAASATSAATTGCERPWDAANHPTTAAGFSFAFGLAVNPTNGNLIITEDPTAGNRSGRGSMWEVPFVN